MLIAQVRPPYVEFKRVALPDPVKSQELGRRVTKDVDFAFIMQPGSKDQVERVAEEWLASIKQKAIDATADAYPDEWVKAFHDKYKAWKDGHDAPLNGTSVKEWAYLSPAQAENFISMGLLCIEDVAAMTEDAMNRFGMGARELREKAREWLQGQKSASSLADENKELRKQLADLTARLSELEAAAPKRGRKPKLETAE